MKKIVLLTVCCLGTTAGAHAFTVQDLQKAAKKKAAHSIDDLIPLIPKKIRQNYTLQHTPSSEQALQKASFAEPRAFLFGEDAKFIATFNAGSGQAGGNVLEVLQFNDREKKFDLFEIYFSADQQLKVDKNPAKCLTCHQAPSGEIYPIFSDYSTWPGFYGRSDDRMDPDSIVLDEKHEAEEYLKFKATSNAHIRYGKLLEQPEIDPQLRAMTPFVSTHGSLLKRPNTRLTLHLFYLNGLRVSQSITHHPQYRKILPLLFYIFGGDRNYIQVKDPKDIDPRRYVGDVFSREEFEKMIKNIYAIFGRTPTKLDIISPQDILDLMGLTTKEISMRRADDTTSRYDIYYFRTGSFFHRQEILTGDIIRDFAKNYPFIELSPAKSFDGYALKDKLTETYIYKPTEGTINSTTFDTRLLQYFDKSAMNIARDADPKEMASLLKQLYAN